MTQLHHQGTQAPVNHSPLAGAISLRDYQQALVDGARDSLRSGHRRIMAYLPTGGGKTRVAVAVAQMTLGKSRGRVVVLANRKQLVHQFAAALRTAGLDVGILQGENTHGLHHRVIVASIDTVHARGCIFDDVAMFIIDEAHAVAGSQKYRTLLYRYNRVPCIGLSATPFARGLGKLYPELGGKPLFEDLIVGATVMSLVDAGYLTDLDIYAPGSPDMTGAKTSRTAEGEDYRQADIELAADKPELIGDIVHHWLKLAEGAKTICFAASIAHSQHLVDQFRAAGVSAEHLDCYMDDDTRQDILTRFEQGDFTVLSNVSLLAEGFDVPDTACMILARPTKSLTRFLQMVGRVLRPSPGGKTHALLLDHSGSVERIGHPFDDLPLELDDGAANKSGKSKQERTKSEPKPCPKCKYVRGAGVHECPKCGFKPQRQSDIAVAAGELVKVARKKKKSAAGHFEKAATFAGLLHIADERGYSQGWASHKYREIFGVWPKGLPSICREPTSDLRQWIRSRDIAWANRREVRHEQA